ncbi:MAG TPA: redoxin family protein [Pyrinomonadaceae bacterium]|nr:redoxin family protein [Pyrinomonadaceae bacterium]
MHRQNVIATGLLVVASAFVITAGYAKGLGPLGLLNACVARLTGGSQLVSSNSLMSETESPTAPEFASGSWINSAPLTLKGLRGRVVLVDFWTFGCYNCRNTLPFIKRWHELYGDKGLTIVGVHSPEFDTEKKVENVRREVASLGIRYPVVTDNDYETWRAYRVEAWPTVFVLDKTGRVRWTHVGEGAYDETDRTIQQLLMEDAKQIH